MFQKTSFNNPFEQYYLYFTYNLAILLNYSKPCSSSNFWFGCVYALNYRFKIPCWRCLKHVMCVWGEKVKMCGSNNGVYIRACVVCTILGNVRPNNLYKWSYSLTACWLRKKICSKDSMRELLWCMDMGGPAESAVPTRDMFGECPNMPLICVLGSFP